MQRHKCAAGPTSSGSSRLQTFSPVPSCGMSDLRSAALRSTVPGPQHRYVFDENYRFPTIYCYRL
jgi:hypothetical protein